MYTLDYIIGNVFLTHDMGKPKGSKPLLRDMLGT